jgi:hypothetical protein
MSDQQVYCDFLTIIEDEDLALENVFDCVVCSFDGWREEALKRMDDDYLFDKVVELPGFTDYLSDWMSSGNNKFAEAYDEGIREAYDSEMLDKLLDDPKQLVEAIRRLPLFDREAIMKHLTRAFKHMGVSCEA